MSDSLLADERRARRSMCRRWWHIWLMVVVGVGGIDVAATMWYVNTFSHDVSPLVRVVMTLSLVIPTGMTYRVITEWRQRANVQRLWTLWALIRERIYRMNRGVVYHNIETDHCVIRTTSSPVVEVIGIASKSDIQEVITAVTASPSELIFSDTPLDGDDIVEYRVDMSVTTIMMYRIWAQTPSSHIMRTVIPIRFADQEWYLIRMRGTARGSRRLIHLLRKIRLLQRLGLLYADESELRDVLSKIDNVLPFTPPSGEMVNM